MGRLTLKMFFIGVLPSFGDLNLGSTPVLSMADMAENMPFSKRALLVMAD